MICRPSLPGERSPHWVNAGCEMPRVVHFEISAEDPERAARFYAGVFGWQVDKWGGTEEYYLVKTGPDGMPGINGGLFRRKGPIGHVNTIDVPSVDDFVKKVIRAGGQLVVAKVTIPGVGYHCYCKDSEGSLFGL